MRDSPRVLVGTLYCGENEFEALKQSLRAQTYPHWKHVVYKNLPNKEAHDRLYSTFVEEQDDFDLFLKLDADMVFRSDEGLEQIVRFFRENPDLDHLTLAVRDWYSDSLIEGLHTFSSRARWETGEEGRFVDPSPVIPGKKQKLWTEPAPVVDHSPDPSPFQAFRFGVHRCLKVLQPERRLLRYRQVRMQWALLKKCWDHFQHDEDRRLGLAVLGADLTIDGEIESEQYNRNQSLLYKDFQAYAQLEHSDLYDRLEPKWEPKWERETRYLMRVGGGRLGFSLLYHIAHKIKQRIAEMG